jgi:uncharacterized membrane protein
MQANMHGMAELVVIAYTDERTGDEALAAMQALEEDGTIDLEDACSVTRDAAGEVELNQTRGLVAAAESLGSLAAHLAGRVSDVGIDDQFIQNVADRLVPGSSALFLLLPHADVADVMPVAARFGGRIVGSTLKPSEEQKLTDALSG